MPDSPPAPAVIFDVDGTLVDVSGVRHYVTDEPRRRNFEKFHAAASYCPPIESTRVLAGLLHAAGARVFIVTARTERWRYRTSVWLRKWGIEHEALLMRPDSDGRPDVAVKRDILAAIRVRYGAEPVLAVDDNPAVIALWTEERVPTIVVPGWDED